MFKGTADQNDKCKLWLFKGTDDQKSTMICNKNIKDTYVSGVKHGNWIDLSHVDLINEDFTIGFLIGAGFIFSPKQHDSQWRFMLSTELGTLKYK